MWPDLLNSIPFYSVYAYAPIIPKFYWEAKSEEQQIRFLFKQFDKLHHYCDMLADSENDTRNAVNELNEIFEEFKNSGFEKYYEQQIYDWVQKNMPAIIASAIKMVFFGLTKDGYFCAYIPENWADIKFDTIVNYQDVNYGCLVLKY